MTEVKSPVINITNKELYPRADPLRPFPKKIENKLARKLNAKKITFAAGKGSSKHIDLSTSYIARVSVQVNSNARAKLVVLGQAHDDVYSLGLINVNVKDGSDFHLIQVVAGGSRIETHVAIRLSGRGANAEYSGILHGKKNAHHALHIVMNHKSPNTTGNIVVKGVYENESRGVISGLIKIDPEAQRTNSYFSDDILLLDNGMAETEPTLEIEANDVKASHGSTTSRVDEDQLFYLESRGIGENQAKRMIISGFFLPIIEQAQMTLGRRLSKTN